MRKYYTSLNIKKTNTANFKQNTVDRIILKRVRFSSSIILLILAIMITSCDKFLDIVPDNVATLENAFTLRNEAERYLFTCYSYLPKTGEYQYNIGMTCGDEIWVPRFYADWDPNFQIANGRQNKDNPLVNVWSGPNNGATSDSKRLFTGLRDCNVFLERLNDMSKVRDITADERQRWIGEVEFLKAYYHFYLLRMYGPIPIVDKNPPIDAISYSKRMPFDDCTNYISDLIDAAIKKLPDHISNEAQELGRVTKPIALAVKAKLWLLAASPLFNGNPDYAGFTDKDGVHLFNPAIDNSKWGKARDAAKAAIDAAEANGNKLFKYSNAFYKLSDTTKVQLNIRQAISEPWNSEIVWGNVNSYFVNSNHCTTLLTRGEGNVRWQAGGEWAAPIKIAKMFYTSNGVPIEEDKTLNFNNYDQLRKSVNSERFNIEPGYRTARLNFDREPRFYADLCFDGGVWYKKDSPSRSDSATFYAQTKYNELGGIGDPWSWNETGYYIKKLVSWQMTFVKGGGTVYPGYPWPEVRLADLYLMYAEALNEVSPASPDAILYLDKIRERAGLKGVVESWSNFSNSPSKYTSQDGLREIIHRERLIELAFEGHRFWDLRRWKKASVELNKDISGWTYKGATPETYTKERVIFTQTFIAPRDYLWPIGNGEIRKNPKMVENPGW